MKAVSRVHGKRVSLLVCAAILAVSQVRGQTTVQGFDLSGEMERQRSLLRQPSQPTTLPLESTINPESYFIGPSDVIAVNIWISPPAGFNLTVTPEGTLIIPTVGEVRVADVTLAEAKERLTAEIRKRYRTGEVTVTLVTPRPVVVTVTGNVLHPGSYVLAAYYRVDRAIEEANKVQRQDADWAAQSVLATMSRRDILVKHKDGSVSNADITRFRYARDDRLNPYLREGDIIVVPRHDFSKNVIGVYGEVNVPGRYEYAVGDSLRDALRMAFGFTPHADTDSVEFTRLGPDGSSKSSMFFNGLAVLEGQGPNFPLESGDRIVVRARPDLRADYRVHIHGEVIYPGVYPITRDRTRLSEAIRMAGGFTETASIKRAELIRRSVHPGEIELERLESLRGGVSPEDSVYYYLETNLRIQKEIVNVDFERLFVQGDSSQDVVLRDEDYINVPSLRTTVYVFGQVVSPGHIPFVQGEQTAYYIGKAGGYTERARRGDLKIVKAKTRQWLSPGETSIEAGDYIWVPKDPERPFAYYMNIIGQTAAVVSVAVSIVLLVIQSGK